MRVVILATVISANCLSALGEPVDPRPPSYRAQQVVVNTQQTLIDAVGDGFRDECWTYPGGLVPTELPNLVFASWPTDHSKSSWRKPIVLRHEASGVLLNVNCYRRRGKPVAPQGKALVRPVAPRTTTPFAALMEPNYDYKRAKFHSAPAAIVTTEDRDLIAFRREDILFKVEASGGTAELRRKLTVDVAQAVWDLQ